ncbi:class I tRNA ligase family protein [Photobacterium sp. WH77]|uniref:class I tRNA ligase family protein n=1 Tax=unclassified Photobacterium TaxID=2628852 RepID=UPI001C4545D1|nr:MULTISPECIES: class I tRNA ligase family protein [unclassified Photobacterium]MBV7262652.1 class I tRNA ligase family protein [Photobacterium sp. WH24]MCG2837781.1 class I tRNA ligase family protein [Photobacterium sp. WH77]MCG2845397.1 class I tRNA ligase family protein [Photobacterium sp. WH80]MDO6582179.1 class I tRNA ligase family protein [Photobacterium sp. 2_MG-2023]
MEPTSFIVTLPPPTPNGGLHVGHMSGPFLAGDVFARALRLQGAPCFVSCYSDIHQSYVRVTAQRQNRSPEELSQFWSEEIHKTLTQYNVSVDDYFVPEQESKNFVRGIFHRLYEDSVLIKKKMPFFRMKNDKVWLDEAGVSGFCPSCMAGCKCGICEACGNLTNAETLIEPRVTNTPEAELELGYHEVLTLELERFKPQLQEFYQNNPRFRQRYRWLTEDVLREDLPAFPVTVPGTWGIAFEHPDFPRQVINAWPELMAQLLYSYQRAIHQDDSLGTFPVPVNFFGFDNSYFYALVHAALLTQIEQGRWLPWSTVINEFYNLDHAKFSTSNNHVIWASDLAERYPVDAIRFYAAFNAPGFEKSNFNEADMRNVLERTLYAHWSQIAQTWNICITGENLTITVSGETTQTGEAIRHRILTSFSPERFHLRQAAEDILHLLSYIEHLLSKGNQLSDAGELLVYFAQAAVPLMPESSQNLYALLTGKDLIGLEAPHVLHLQHLPESFHQLSCKEATSREEVIV